MRGRNEDYGDKKGIIRAAGRQRSRERKEGEKKELKTTA